MISMGYSVLGRVMITSVLVLASWSATAETAGPHLDNRNLHTAALCAAAMAAASTNFEGRTAEELVTIAKYFKQATISEAYRLAMLDVYVDGGRYDNHEIEDSVERLIDEALAGHVAPSYYEDGWMEAMVNRCDVYYASN